jgi:hypothetical protein
VEKCQEYYNNLILVYIVHLEILEKKLDNLQKNVKYFIIKCRVKSFRLKLVETQKA